MNETTFHGGEPPLGCSPPVRERASDYALPDSKPGNRFATQTGFAGHALHDPLGRKIGKVEKMFVNGRGEPEYIAANIGPLWRKQSVLNLVRSTSLEDGGRRALVLK